MNPSFMESETKRDLRMQSKRREKKPFLVKRGAKIAKQKPSTTNRRKRRIKRKVKEVKVPESHTESVEAITRDADYTYKQAMMVMANISDDWSNIDYTSPYTQGNKGMHGIEASNFKASALSANM